MSPDASRPTALFLAPEAPYPLMGGGALRSASLLNYLARRYEVDVIVFRQPGAENPGVHFPPGLVRALHVVDLPRHSRYAPARLLRNAGRLIRRVPPLLDRFAGFAEPVSRLLQARRYDLSVIEHFWCAPYWKQLAPASARTVLDLHNIESILHARCARVEPWPYSLAHRVFQRACVALERRWFPHFSCLLAASVQDAQLIREISPAACVLTYPNAIPMAPLPPKQEEEVIVFSGNLEYHPNISAVRFFRREIWPSLRNRWPQLVWRLIGQNPHAVEKFTAGDSRIEVRGSVRDAIVELARAKVAVVPLLAGSGTRFKILEAWAAGVPVVSTRMGAEGLPARHQKNILLADDPVGFGDAVSSLLASPDLRARLSQAGRAVFEKECTWEAAWARLNL